MDQEQEINNLKRKLLDLSYDYYKFRVSLYYKVIFILLFLFVGLQYMLDSFQKFGWLHILSG